MSRSQKHTPAVPIRRPASASTAAGMAAERVALADRDRRTTRARHAARRLAGAPAAQPR